MFANKMVPYVLAIFFVVFDRLFKVLAVNSIFEPPVSLGRYFQLDFSANYDIAFSLPLRGFFLEIAIGLICFALAVLYFYLLSKAEYASAYAVFLVILGAGSNFYDRLSFGYVVDYIDVSYFTVFNLADGLIVCGAVLLAWLRLRKPQE